MCEAVYATPTLVWFFDHHFVYKFNSECPYRVAEDGPADWKLLGTYDTRVSGGQVMLVVNYTLTNLVSRFACVHKVSSTRQSFIHSRVDAVHAILDLIEWCSRSNRTAEGADATLSQSPQAKHSLDRNLVKGNVFFSSYCLQLLGFCRLKRVAVSVERRRSRCIRLPLGPTFEIQFCDFRPTLLFQRFLF